MRSAIRLETAGRSYGPEPDTARYEFIFCNFVLDRKDYAEIPTQHELLKAAKCL